MVFFDKFCPDLHGPGDGDDSLVAINPSNSKANADDDRPVPSRPPVAPSAAMMTAACRWCSKELGNAPVVVLSEGDNDGPVGDGGSGSGSCAGRGEEGGRQGGGGEGEAGGMPPRVLGLREFLRDFVGGEAGEELARRGDLLRGVHLSNKVTAWCGYSTISRVVGGRFSV